MVLHVCISIFVYLCAFTIYALPAKRHLSSQKFDLTDKETFVSFDIVIVDVDAATVKITMTFKNVFAFVFSIPPGICIPECSLVLERFLYYL